MVHWMDTHVHFPADPDDRARWVARAKAAGVDGMVAVGGSCELNKSAAETAAAFPGDVRAAIGFDRDEVSEINSPAMVEDAVDRLRRSIAGMRDLGIRICAVGEIGLDYHYRPGTADAQQALFAAQCRLAVELDLPVIVHSREAEADTLAILEAGDGHARCGVLHCFTGNRQFASQLLEMGMMISFSGIVTFRNADALREVAATVPDDRLLIETDSPFLAPIPYRGKPNEPAFLPAVADTVAHVRGVSRDSIATLTSTNASRLFGA